MLEWNRKSKKIIKSRNIIFEEFYGKKFVVTTCKLIKYYINIKYYIFG